MVLKKNFPLRPPLGGKAFHTVLQTAILPLATRPLLCYDSYNIEVFYKFSCLSLETRQNKGLVLWKSTALRSNWTSDTAK